MAGDIPMTANQLLYILGAGMLIALALLTMRFWRVVFRRLDRRADRKIATMVDAATRHPWMPTPPEFLDAGTGDEPTDQAVAEQVDLEPAPTLVPCGLEWHHGDDTRPHVCVLIGGHRIHRCRCGAFVAEQHLEEPEPDPEPIAIDPPAAPYTTDGMVKLGRWSHCRRCVDARTSGQHELICDTCRPSLVGSASGLPGGAS